MIKKTFSYYVDALKKYVDFSGRADRTQFWYFVLWSFIISIIISLVSEDLVSIYSLLIFLPSIAIGTRRLHDIGKSGWWQLIALIPIVGVIWLIILFAREGEKKENRYGKVPMVHSDEEKKEENLDKLDSNDEEKHN